MNQKYLISYLINHPKFAKGLLSLYFPFNKDQLYHYKAELNWSFISQNTSIVWTEEIFSQFAYLLNWDYISLNPSAFKDVSLIDKFSHFINWQGSDQACGDTIANNTGVPWCEKLIEKYKYKINFEKLSTNEAVKWNENLVDKYFDQWNILELACNEGFPWTLRLFDKYLDESYFSYYPVTGNITLISNLDFIEKYKDSICWISICSNSNLPWAELDLLNRWANKIDWYGIAQNDLLFKIDNNFFAKHLDKWMADPFSNFIALSRNNSISWSRDLIDNYRLFWDWENLCTNESIPWEIELIHCFRDFVKWGGLTPSPIYTDDGEILATTGGKSLEFGLVMNKSIPWSIDFLEHFEKEIEFEWLLNNDAVWEKVFKTQVDHYVIDKVLRII